MVYAHQWFVPEEAEGAGGEGDGLEGGTHAGALCVAYYIDGGRGEAGLVESLLDEAGHPAAVVQGGVFGEEAGAGRGDEGVAEVGEDVDAGGVRGAGGRGVVLDDAYAELVGGALEA